MKKYFLAYFLISVGFLKAQNPVFVGVGFDIGIPTANQYAENKSVLHPKTGHHFNTSLYVSTILSNRVGLQLGVGQNNQLLKLNDEQFRLNHGKRYEATTTFQNLYPNLEAALFYNQPLSDKKSAYLKFGWRMNYPGNKKKKTTETFMLDDTQIEAEGTFNKKSAALLGEIGIRFGESDGSQAVVGLKYVHGYETNAVMTYNTTHPLNNVSDVFSTKGSYIGLFLGLDIFVTEWDYPSFNMKIGGNRKPRRSKNSTINTTNTQTTSPSSTSSPGNRTEEVVRTLTINDPKITLKIYDPNKVDNDIVTVWLNGTVIVDNLSVKKEPYIQEVTLSKGLNKITFQAMNLGKISPNTAEMIVLANGATYKVTFNTTLEKNQVLEINVP